MVSPMQPVDVISVCSASGEIRPLRLRLEDESSGLCRVDIDRILDTKQIQYRGLEAFLFLCSATWQERQWIFQLKYTVRTHSWSLQSKS